MQENQDPLKNLKDLIEEWKINKPTLAEKMGLNYSTFKNKFHRSGGRYDFTEAEQKKLCEIVFLFGKKLSTISANSMLNKAETV